MEMARGTAAGCTPTDKIVSSLSEKATHECHGPPSISMASQGDSCTFDSVNADEYWRMGGYSSNEGDELQTMGRILDEVLGDDGRLRQEQKETAEGNKDSRDSSGNTRSEQRPRKTEQTLSSRGISNVFIC